MRWRCLSAAFLLLATCGGIACCASASVPRAQPNKKALRWMRKAVVYETANAKVLYTITLSPESRATIQCVVEIANRGTEPIFFLRAARAMSARKEGNRRYLDVSIGIQEQHFEYSIPRLEEIQPGKRTTANYEVDCRGQCRDLDHIDVDLFLIIEKGKFFHDLFKGLPNYGKTLGLNIGPDWEMFYRYLQTETVPFSLVRPKP